MSLFIFDFVFIPIIFSLSFFFFLEKRKKVPSRLTTASRLSPKQPPDPHKNLQILVGHVMRYQI